MKPENIQMPARTCTSIRDILDRVGDKWSVYLIGMLCHGPKRFNALKRGIEGISQRMLTLTLRGLERDGLITRTVYPTVPPQVEYDLTPLGHTLRGPVSALFEWSVASSPQIALARQAYDSRQEGAVQKVA